MRRTPTWTRRWAAILLLGPAAACSPEIPTEVRDLPPVQGEWTYSASDIRVAGRSAGPSCTIRDLVLDIGPWRAAGFYGRTAGGVMACDPELAGLAGPLAEFPIRRGGSVLQYIAFDIGNPDWRHDGVISADTMSGVFTLRQGLFALEGRFRAVRRPAR